MAKNGWKQVFDDTYLPNLLFYTQKKYVIWANQWCWNILGYLQRCLLHSWPHIVTLWATIGTHLWAKMAENGWKQVFDDTYLHNILFYTQVCYMGQQVVFNYPMLSPKVPPTLVIPNSYSTGHHSHSFVSKHGRKRLKTGFQQYLPPKPLIPHTNLFYWPTSGVQLSYGITQGAYYNHDSI
jgi:hypothetical protein